MVQNLYGLQCPMLVLQLKALLANNVNVGVIEVFLESNQAWADVERFLIKKTYCYQKLKSKDKICFRIQI
jgi:TusA-related sulfurtransferase